MAKQITETKFKNFCNKNKYFSKKFSATNDGGFKNAQEADFLVANHNDLYFVEVKECSDNRFSFDRFTQYKKLALACKKANIIKPRILINFKNYEIVVYMTLNEYTELIKKQLFKNGKLKKSITILQVPIEYHIDWKHLKLK